MVDIQRAILETNRIHGVNQTGTSTPTPQPSVDGPKFEDVLKNEIDQESTVRLSAHAQRRIEARDIDFGPEQTAKLEQAVDKAAGKGSRESLILMDDLALVVSIQNRVVITAVDANNRKNDVFTNIDSVVLT